MSVQLFVNGGTTERIQKRCHVMPTVLTFKSRRSHRTPTQPQLNQDFVAFRELEVLVSVRRWDARLSSISLLVTGYFFTDSWGNIKQYPTGLM